MLDAHWAVLLFFALNPALLPSLVSKGEEQVAVSVSAMPACRPLIYLDCGWSKVNWGRGMYSPVRGERLAAGETGRVCEKGIGLGTRGACGWMKTFGLMGMCVCVGVAGSGGV